MDLTEIVQHVKVGLRALQAAQRIEAMGKDPTDRARQGLRPIRSVVVAHTDVRDVEEAIMEATGWSIRGEKATKAAEAAIQAMGGG